MGCRLDDQHGRPAVVLQHTQRFAGFGGRLVRGRLTRHPARPCHDHGTLGERCARGGCRFPGRLLPCRGPLGAQSRGSRGTGSEIPHHAVADHPEDQPLKPLPRRERPGQGLQGGAEILTRRQSPQAVKQAGAVRVGIRASPSQRRHEKGAGRMGGPGRAA